MVKKLTDFMLFKRAHDPTAQTADTVVAQIIDRRGYDRLLIIIPLGVGVGTKVLDFTLYDDDAVGFGSPVLFATIATLTSQGADDALYLADINLDGAEQFLRLTGINDDTVSYATIYLLYYTNGLELPPTQEETALVVTIA